MDYKKALKKRYDIGDFIQEKDIKIKVIVAPKKNDDFQRFLGDYRIRKFDDESCLKYSTDSQFKVVGLWSDGTNVLFKDI